jgi:outer membrane protein assembly factor BamB
MKKLFVILFCFWGMAAMAQNPKPCKLFIKLVDQENFPIAFADFWLNDPVLQKQIPAKTNQYGNAELMVDRGKTYSFNYKATRDYIQIETPLHSSILERTIVLVSNQNISSPPDTIVLSNPPGRAAGPNEALANQTWLDKNKLRIRNMPVYLYNRAENRVYVSVSDDMGNTRFLVPEGRYFMSVGMLQNYKEIEIVKTEGLPFSEFTTFIRTDIPEKTLNDTIVQSMQPTQEGTSESGMFIIKLRDFEKKPIPGELVWVNVSGSQKVYKAVTDQYGMAKILLPKGITYQVNLKYARLIDQFSFPLENTNHVHQLGYAYLGSKTIETFYQEVKRNEDGYQTEFKFIPIEALTSKVDVSETKTYGFNLNFKNNQPCSPPVIAENKLFVSGGYYSRHFYGFDSQTGKFIWGVELAEAGASPTVYLDGVLLINTQSCTLYAIEASSGKLLWSKWLGPNIYSTPTAFDGMVYTVYPRVLQRYDLVKHGLNPFVLVAFHLKTGEIMWQKGLDSDVVASPVAAPNGLYLTTVSGNLYRFNPKTGHLLAKENTGSISPPTLYDGKLASANLLEELSANYKTVLLDTSKLLPIKKSGLPAAKFSGKQANDAYQRMSFMQGRIVHSFGRNFGMFGENLVCMDAQTLQPVWTKNLGNVVPSSFFASPTVLKNQVLVPALNGKLMVFDAKTGNNTKTFSTNYAFWSSPVVHNGWIYISTIDGQIVCINTKDPKTYTGWPQWGFDASHNLWVR